MSMRLFSKLLAPLERRIKLLVNRAVVRLVDPASFIQLLQVEALAGEPLDGVEHVEPYGFTSHPHAKAEAVLLSLGGRRAHTIAVVVGDRRYRLKELAEGEVALHDDLGNVVHFMRDRLRINAVQHLQVTAPTTEISSTTTHAGDVTIEGDLVVSGQITSGPIISSGINLTNHTHTGDSGGSTGGPQ